MGLVDLGMKMTQRPLEVIYAIDVSASMWGEKIDAVNKAMHLLEQEFKNVARKNPGVDIRIRVITFGGDEAKYIIPGRTKPENFKWQDINDPDGMTPMGGAFKLMTKAMDNSNMSLRGLRPILVLMSDGMPNDDAYEQELDNLLATKWGNKAVKVAIGMGEDEELDLDILNRFVDGTSQVLRPEDAQQIVEYIKWTSTIVGEVSHHLDDGGSVGNKRESYICPNTVIMDDGLFD